MPRSFLKMQTKLQTRLCIAGALILVLGLLSAVGIYFTANDEVGGAIGYQVIAGQTVPITAENSRSYRYQLERNGGKMALVMDDFARWFGGLWHGRQLAYTLAFLAMALSIACFYLADLLSEPPLEDGGGEAA